MFVEFCGWNGLSRTAGDMTRRIAAYAVFFCVIGQAFGRTADISQETLLASFGAEGLRRGFLVVRYLIERLALPWEAEFAEAWTEVARTEARMASVVDKPWSADLEAFRLHLEATRLTEMKTRHGYVTAAAGLLEHAGVERAEGLTAKHITRYLRRRPGQSANLQRFLFWVSDRTDHRFERSPKQAIPPRRREKATLRKAAELMARLAAAREPREGRAMLAACIAALHHLPLSDVLAIRQCDVAFAENRIVLWPSSRSVELATPLAAGFARFIGVGSSLAFPGRNGAQPLAPSTVLHHLRKKSVTSKAKRRGTPASVKI